MLDLSFLFLFHFGVEVAYDAVGEADGGDKDVVGVDAVGNGEEDFGGGDDDVGAVRLQVVTVHTLFDGEW